ncbi:amidohydrolase/deacetylase family metallohydrolase [Rouxiella chamberiensis]|uniref:Amidohydrolase/deacetylase family metallohydrolase n=1 Tax=Rouxiella chamberiensis TaxID=1513468 RepID=A0ABY7HM39_9GAMM|nr:amidohydrolase/deacetylase family metallohydrolase [Rouxiella chamberiensis]WAT00308.1 amidohydrolase/deacetylase family metallohydrolase [Rouxiella chamberiensis]
MFDLILRQAKTAGGELLDIAVFDGKLAAIGSLAADAKATQVYDLQGKYWVSAGWIDSHVHCYAQSPLYHDEPDCVGVGSGVTTVIDAGSTGANDVDDFYRITRDAKTNVFAFLNIARTGIVTQNELADLSQIDKVGVRQAIARHSDFILGLKARMSSSVVGQNGIKPLEIAKTMQRENAGLPLMVHIGNNPPNLDDIADLLTSGDIITHCYNGKPNRILTAEGELRASIKRALARGVLLDVGHGSASFSFAVAEIAIRQGILPHTISSDIYCRNRLAGPVHSLATVMSKFFGIGLTLAQVIDCVTVHAADALRLPAKGRLEVGADADLTLFDIVHTPQVFIDSEGLTLEGDRILVPLAAIVAGVPLPTDEGKSKNVFNL